MEGFKELVKRAQKGEFLRVLHISPTSSARDVHLLEMINEAHDLNAGVMYNRVTHTMHINNAVFMLRVAHDRLDEQMRGLELSAILGLEYIESLGEAQRVSSELRFRVRT